MVIEAEVGAMPERPGLVTIKNLFCWLFLLSRIILKGVFLGGFLLNFPAHRSKLQHNLTQSGFASVGLVDRVCPCFSVALEGTR